MGEREGEKRKGYAPKVSMATQRPAETDPSAKGEIVLARGKHKEEDG